MTCGVAGSGRTTIAQRLEARGMVGLSIGEEIWRRFGRYGLDYEPAQYAEHQTAAVEAARPAHGPGSPTQAPGRTE